MEKQLVHVQSGFRPLLVVVKCHIVPVGIKVCTHHLIFRYGGSIGGSHGQKLDFSVLIQNAAARESRQEAAALPDASQRCKLEECFFILFMFQGFLNG